MHLEAINMFDSPTGELIVRHLGPDDVSKYAKPILGVMVAAYTREFEEIQGLLPEGSVQSYFDELTASQPERMHTYMAGGSHYLVAHTGSRYETGPDNIVGVVKTSDSRANIFQKLRLETPNCYVNDISVMRPREGVGSALLAVATKLYHPDAGLATDVLPGSEAFFQRANLVPAARQPRSFAPLEIGGIPLHDHMVRFHNPFSGVITTRQRLIQRKPWIAEGMALTENG